MLGSEPFGYFSDLRLYHRKIPSNEIENLQTDSGIYYFIACLNCLVYLLELQKSLFEVQGCPKVLEKLADNNPNMQTQLCRAIQALAVNSKLESYN